MSAKQTTALLMVLSLGLTSSAAAQGRSRPHRSRPRGDDRRAVVQPASARPAFAPRACGPRPLVGKRLHRPGNFPQCNLPRRRVWVPAHYEIRERQVIIPAEYHTVFEQVWVEPIYEWQTRRVWVPEPHGTHVHVRLGDVAVGVDVGRRRHGHFRTVQEQVLIEQGHYTTVEKQVLVHPERIDVIRERVLVREGHWRRRRC